MRANSYDKVKRVLDIVGATVLLVVLSPVLVILALIARIQMGSPFLFHQQRLGRNGVPFTLYKFRTMDGFSNVATLEEIVASDAERLTPYGIFLRSTSLDELPELFNILKGDMSFVGPRPLPIEYGPLYSKTQARRHEVRPGLTGLAQVNGRNALSWPERFKYDIEYVDDRSFGLDASILLKTIGVVFNREGVSSETTVTMEPFHGNNCNKT